MKKINSKAGAFWVGYHPKTGPVIYNPRSQRGMEDDKVRLYKLDESCSGTFIKAIVRDKLVAPNDKIWAGIESAITSYMQAFEQRSRVTHCYNCKKHLDSVEFSICRLCGWIKCSCSACGCNYNKVEINKFER